MSKSLLEQLPEIVAKQRQEAECIPEGRHRAALLYAVKCRGIAVWRQLQLLPQQYLQRKGDPMKRFHSWLPALLAILALTGCGREAPPSARAPA